MPVYVGFRKLACYAHMYCMQCTEGTMVYFA